MNITGLFELGSDVDWPDRLIDVRSLMVAFVFIPALVIATFTDLRFGKIYDRLNYPLMFVALLISLVEEFQVSASLSGDAGGLRSCISGGFVCFGLMIFNYILVGGGGGDVKLATALGMAFGVISGINILILTYFLGAIHVVVCHAVDTMRFAQWRIQGHNSDLFIRRFSRHSKIRMAPYFLMATLITIVDA